MTRTIMCFGDSNTHGTVPMPSIDASGRFPHAARWPSVMGKALGEEFEVISEGHPGRTTAHDDPIEGKNRNATRVLSALLDSHLPLDLVIIKLGTNDLKYRFHLSATDVAFGVENLINIIRASTAGPEGAAPKVMVVCPPPIIEVGDLGDIFADGAAKSQGLSATFTKMAARLNVHLVDAGTLIAVSHVDGIHYEPLAQLTLGLAMADAVRAEFE
ncbi:MAG: SGNH/GDSL hydrolase family protein [Paracoccaceae bacterium]